MNGHQKWQGHTLRKISKIKKQIHRHFESQEYHARHARINNTIKDEGVMLIIVDVGLLDLFPLNDWSAV